MLKLDAMLAGKRILAIDDLVESRSAMKKMLMILGATKVDIAMDGDEASNYIQNNYYDIVISDYNLGRGRDGQQILEEARFTRRLKATSTFVMLTGENAMDMVMGAIEYEPDDYVTKPFTIDVMRKRLTRILVVKEHLKPINEAIDKQAKDTAIRLCDELMQSKPKLTIRLQRIKGRLLLGKHRFEEASELYDLILSEREISWALLGRAFALLSLDRLNEATETLNFTIKEHPKYVQCFDLLSKVHIKKKELKEAQLSLEQATQVSPKQVLRQMELGRLAYINKDFKVAESAFRQSVKLARHSCYKSAKNYLFFAKSLQHKITVQNNRDSRDGSNEAFKTLDEAKAVYKDNNEYLFEATIIESNTFTSLGKTADAKAKADKANELLEHISEPTGSQQLAMATAYLGANEHAKAQDILALVNARKDLSRAEERELNRTREEISESVVRQYTTDINDKAIGFFERGQLSQAIELFDQATSYKESGISVLLNAIQAKIAYMDQRSADKEMFDDVAELIQRIGDISPGDERYDRWEQLKKSHSRIKRLI